MRWLRRSRRSTKPINLEVAKDDAVRMVLLFVLVSFALGFFIAFVVLPWLSSSFASDKKGLEISLGIVLTLLTGGLLTVCSWDSISSKISAAINAGVLEKLDGEKKKYDLDAAINRQKNEFNSIVNLLSLIFSRDGGFIFPISVGDDYIRRLNARDAITRGLAYNDKILQKIALAASLKALERIDPNQAEIDQDVDLQLFYCDIYIYLKAWLMLSIANDREMEADVIKQRYSGQEKKYVNALRDIQTRLIKDKRITKCLDARYREDAIELLDEYLIKLIEKLSKQSLDRKTAR